MEGGAGEEAEGEVVLVAGAAEAVDGGVEVGGGLREVAGGAALGGEEVGAAEGEVVEGDVEERVARYAPPRSVCAARSRTSASRP